MSDQILEIKYKCLHPSCIVNCREGLIDLDPETFKELSDAVPEEGRFRSPRGFCRMGFSQTLRADEVRTLDPTQLQESDEGAGSLDTNDPVAVLMHEHQEVIGLMDLIETQLRKRDLEALWQTSAKLEDELILHSIKKEEQVLFPILKDLLPLGEGLVAIVKEDHIEVMNLLHAFRDGLADGDIFDGIINSVITNLKSHIRKEDEEFFDLVGKSLDEEARKTVLEGMKEIVENHPPLNVMSRAEYAEKNITNAEQREYLNAQIAAVKDLVNVNADGGCGCSGEDLGETESDLPEAHQGHGH